jgi:hypothetical protein
VLPTLARSATEIMWMQVEYFHNLPPPPRRPPSTGLLDKSDNVHLDFVLGIPLSELAGVRMPSLPPFKDVGIERQVWGC